MGLRHYNHLGYYEEYGDAVHAALADLWTLRHAALKLDDEGRERLAHAGWSWTSEYSMESDPFGVIDHQLQAVLYATGYDLEADVRYAYYEELEEVEDLMQGSRDAAGRPPTQDPALEPDGWHEGLLFACAHGDRTEVRRLAFDLARLARERERRRRPLACKTLSHLTPKPLPRVYIKPERPPADRSSP